MEWKDPAKDQAIADRLQGKMLDRLSEEGDKYNKTSKEVDKIKDKISATGGSEKLTKQLDNATKELAAISGTISDLEQSVNELNEMGSKDVHQKFDFNEVTDTNVGGTTKDADGTIVMAVNSDANAVHEATHGYAEYRGTESRDQYDKEILPYQRQFSFDPSSVDSKHVPSVMGEVSSRSDVTPKWVSGIYDPSAPAATKFIYTPGATRKDIVTYWKTH